MCPQVRDVHSLTLPVGSSSTTFPKPKGILISMSLMLMLGMHFSFSSGRLLSLVSNSIKFTNAW